MTVLQDYVDLFSYKRKGHMAQYFYIHRPEIYDQLLKNDDYYPFRREVEILSEKSDYIASKLSDVTEVIEIGPGSDMSIIHKTIPFLKGLSNSNKLLQYTGLDFSREYAEHACSTVKKHFQNIQTASIVGDFLEPNVFKNIKNNNKSKKLFFCFGQSIFPNNTDHNVDVILDNLNQLMVKEDYLFLGVDLNRDKILMEKAYNNLLTNELLLNTMHHLKSSFNLPDFNPEAFEFSYQWDKKQKKVKTFFTSLNNQTIVLGRKSFSIKQGQIFNIANSRKLNLSTIKKALKKKNILSRWTVTCDTMSKQNYAFLIAQKI